MPTSGFPLTGIPANDPNPGILRELRVAQGASYPSGGDRAVVFMANKSSAGTETLDTLGDPVVDETDCINRFGVGSEAHLCYRSFNLVPQSATIYIVAPTAGTGNGTVDFTITGNASANTTLEFAVIGEKVQVGVTSGDTPDIQKANAILAINRQLHWPVVASSGGTGIVRLTTKCSGTRHDYHLTRSRCRYLISATSAVSKGSVTPASTDDDLTSAILAIEAANIYYQVCPKQPTSAPTGTDNGLGEHSTSITSQILPINGKSCVGIAGLCGTQAQATTVATASSMNNAFYFLVHAENNDWPGSMLAAHYCGIKRSKEIAHPAANINGYGTKSGQICLFPDPYDKNDRPTAVELTADLNNGVTPIKFDTKGNSQIWRDVTSRSWQGATSTNDYRCREGHIPSVLHSFSEQFIGAWRTCVQDFVDADPVEGQKIYPGVTYPRDAKSLFGRVVDNALNTAGGPMLAPSQADAMKAAFEVVKVTGGISAHMRVIAVEHMVRSTFLIDEASAAY